jgi:hypothetical protein
VVDVGKVVPTGARLIDPDTATRTAALVRVGEAMDSGMGFS